MPTASDMTVIDHPNSWCNGTISAPGAPRKPAAPSRARKATAATHHPGCRRGWWRVRMCSGERDDISLTFLKKAILAVSVHEA